jgi:hypothetical protein
MHIKGSCHIAAECRLREKELSMQQEISKRLAISSVPSIVDGQQDKYVN